MKHTRWDRIKPGTLLLIFWDDIVSDSSWVKDAAAQAYSPIHCKNIGWFINADTLNIRITDSINSENEKSVTVIPKGVIRSVRKIKYERD